MKVAISGFLTLGIYMVLFLEGTRQTAPAEAATVLATIPLFAVLWSAILGIEAVRANVMLGTVVAMTGVAVVMFGGGMAAKGSLFGDLNILAAAVVWSFAAVQAKPLLARYSPVQLLAMGMPFAFPVILLYGGTSVLHARFDHISLTSWVMFAQVALLSGVVAFAGFYIGIQQVGSAVATRYQFFVPLVAVAFAALVLGQTLLPIQFLGMAMVIAGVFFGASKPNLSSTTSRESILVTSIAE